MKRTRDPTVYRRGSAQVGGGGIPWSGQGKEGSIIEYIYKNSLAYMVGYMEAEYVWGKREARSGNAIQDM